MTPLPLATLLLLATTPADDPTPPSGAAVLRAPAGGSEIVLTTTDRLAGAVHSITWDGREFIDSTDHGRQLQSAASFDCSRPGEFWPERYNPTEAGSRADHTGPTSTSRLLDFHADARSLRSTTRMAFWLQPGEDSSGRPALNREPLSRHLLKRDLRLGRDDLPNVLDHTVTFVVPEGETHTLGQFEALTGYMPPDFSRFWTLDPKSGDLTPLDDGPGEQPLPVVFSTPDARHAMGIVADPPDDPRLAGPTYGRFRFEAERVVKWNCVFRERDPNALPPGPRTFRLHVAIGTLDDVRRSLLALARPAHAR
jgi:hypothetical protein